LEKFGAHLKGKDLRYPTTQVNSETILAVLPGSNLINQCSSAVDNLEQPHIVFILMILTACRNIIIYGLMEKRGATFIVDWDLSNR